MTRSLAFIAGGLSLVVSMAAAASDAPVYVPAPRGDYDAYGLPFPWEKRVLRVMPPRADPQHPNPGVDEFYPPSSRRLGEVGTVTLLLTVAEDGKVLQARVQDTSGQRHLDEVAQHVATTWRFLPGTISGKPTTMQMPIKVTFK